MARLYSNENFPYPVVEELRTLGHEVLTTHDAGQAGRAIPDIDVLRFASADGRAVLTLNRRHFVRLHLNGEPHAGIIVCTVDPDFGGQARRLHAALTSMTDLRGQLLRINRPQTNP